VETGVAPNYISVTSAEAVKVFVVGHNGGSGMDIVAVSRAARVGTDVTPVVTGRPSPASLIIVDHDTLRSDPTRVTITCVGKVVSAINVMADANVSPRVPDSTVVVARES